MKSKEVNQRYGSMSQSELRCSTTKVEVDMNKETRRVGGGLHPTRTMLHPRDRVERYAKLVVEKRKHKKQKILVVAMLPFRIINSVEERAYTLKDGSSVCGQYARINKI